MRDRTVGETFFIAFTTRAFATGIPTILSGSPVISAYEDASLTQITAGITLGVDHDSVTGLNLITVVATGGNGFEAGKDYSLVITAGTVGGVSVIGEVVGSFSLGLSAAFTRIGAAGAGLSNIGTIATVTTLTNKTGFSLAATGLDAIVSTATGMVEIAKAIWDRVLTGATHNVATSAGRRLRQLTGMVYTDGTAQAGSVNTITLAAGESATDDIFWQAYIAIVGGTGAGQGHHIISYNGTTKVAVVDDDWIVQPDATSEYVIFGSGSHDELMTGLAQAGAASTITLESTSCPGDDLIKDCYVAIVSGAGEHQARLITAYNGTTKVATVYPDWVVNPDATSGYRVLPEGQNNVWDQLITGSLHNIVTSSGRRLRQCAESIAHEGSVNDAGASTTSLDIDAAASAVDDFYVDQTLRFIDGALDGQARIILTYVGATRTVTFDEALTSAPANGVGIQIIADHVHPVSQITDGIWDEATTDHTTAGTTGKAIIDIQAKTDNLPDGIQKNTALANFPFFMVDDTDNVTGKTGLSITAQRSIDGAAFANCANSAVELSNGVYVIDLAASDLNGDTVIFKFTGTDALARLITVITQT